LYNFEFLSAIRAAEMDELAPLIPPRSRVLEFGAGRGEQAKMLADRGFDVVAIDLADSSYSGSRVWPVIDYDGRHIPLPDHSIDAIFSSNVLEHVEDLKTILAEFRRVLKPGGIEVHAMPTTAWRFWTFVAGVPAAFQAAFARNLKAFAGALLPIGHGTSSEGFSELWTFSRTAWRKVFRNNGHVVVEDRPMGVFYTGHMALGRQLSFDRRRKLSRYIGSGTHIYVVKPRP
jgi:SAM-dependent methyltransferase